MRRDGRWNEVQNCLKGKDLYIVASGPSLIGFDFRRLAGRITLAINHTIEYFTTADMLIFSDKVFLDKTRFNLNSYKGKIFCSEKCAGTPPISDMITAYDKKLYLYEDRRDEPLMHPKKGLYHPTNTALAAINLGLQMNAGKIYLLGYDYYTEKNGNKHFYPDKDHHKKYPFERYLQKLKKFKAYEKWSARIYNLNPDSLLDTFQKLPMDSVL